MIKIIRKMLPEISAIINTYNEKSNIDICLKRLKLADEIIIVDMYSSDKTIEISKKYKVKIYYHKNHYHVEPARNYAISKATKEWVLVLDADESLSPNAEERIKQIVLDKKTDGYSFPRRVYINENIYLKYGYFYPDYQLRLFRNNGKIKYSGKIHEQPVIPKEKIKYIDSIEILHNTSHCKYDSYLHFFRFKNYIPIEGKLLGDSGMSIRNLLKTTILDFPRHTYRSFIKLKGYKDGYPGFRAAVIFSLYKSCVNLYALFFRLKRVFL